MIAFFRRQPFWMWTLCITLLVVRVSGAHWHLCFDGHEPPATVHTGDTAAAHHTGNENRGNFSTSGDSQGSDHASANHHSSLQQYTAQHTDVDLNLVDNGLFKLLTTYFPATLTLLAFLLLIIAGRRNTPPPYVAPFFSQLTLHRSPPPRGPPL